MKKLIKVVLLLSVAISQTNISHAVGSGALGNIAGVSAKAMGYGYAFGGIADDPSAIYFNPAGLTQVKGLQYVAGASVLEFNTDHTASATTAGGRNGQEDKTASNNPLVPFFYISYSKHESPLTYGLGVNSPFGLITEWKDDSFSKFYATKSKLLMYVINPSVAYKLSEKFSVGAGVDFFNVFDAELNSMVANVDSPLIPGSPTGNGRKRLTGDGTGWGYNLGIHMKANEKNSFGLSYRSQVNVIIEGETELTGLQDGTAFAFNGNPAISSFKTNTSTEFKFPQSLLFGYGYKPNDKWTILADYEWVNWNVVTDTTFNYERRSPLDTTAHRVSRNWKNTNNIGFGAELKANNWWDLRFGAFAYERVIPSETLEASLPESGRWGINIGSGFHFGNNSIDVAYNPVFLNKRSINNNEERTTYSQDGDFKSTLHVFSVSFSQKFGGS